MNPRISKHLQGTMTDTEHKTKPIILKILSIIFTNYSSDH